MEKHELTRLEAHIQSVKAAHTLLADSTDLDELWKIIHRPGWTTPAERMLVTTSLEYLEAQTRLVATLRQNLLAGAKAVGTAQAAGA
jgi:hypothetical protein